MDQLNSAFKAIGIVKSAEKCCVNHGSITSFTGLQLSVTG